MQEFYLACQEVDCIPNKKDEIDSRFSRILQTPYLSDEKEDSYALFSLRSPVPIARAYRRFLFVPKCQNRSTGSPEIFQENLKKANMLSRNLGAPLFFAVPLFEHFSILWHNPLASARLFMTAVMTSLDTPLHEISYILDGRLLSPYLTGKVDDARRWDLYITFCEHLCDFVGSKQDQKNIRILIHANSFLDTSTSTVIDPAILNRAVLLAYGGKAGVWYDMENGASASHKKRERLCPHELIFHTFGKGISYEQAVQIRSFS